ncbi:MAG: SOS response-associated peptidase [Rubrivivax sp.]|nr:SOS response-associated peptidase [Rubrivivax sp.]
MPTSRRMCGRYVVAYDPETLVAGFSVLRVPVFPRRWNVAPQSEVPVVYETRQGERIAELMRWGLVPSWASNPALGHKLNNARAEGLFDKPSFRQAALRRRCLLPASGFYEWQAVAAGGNARPAGRAKVAKQPWYVSATSGEPLAMAGLFEAWRSGPEAPWLLTCCVITCEANALMAPIHERMPVLLARRDWAPWLSRSVQDAAAIAPLLAVPPAEGLQAWPVAAAVSRGSSEGPELVLPLPAAPTTTAPAAPTEPPAPAG